MYNVEQTGLFYQKHPNSLYIDKKQNKAFSGTKAMKDKTHVTVMAWFAADGHILPLSLVRKNQETTFFKTDKKWKSTLSLHL